MKYLIFKIFYSVMCLVLLAFAYLGANTVEEFGICLFLAVLCGLAVAAIDIEEIRQTIKDKNEL